MYVQAPDLVTHERLLARYEALAVELNGREPRALTEWLAHDPGSPKKIRDWIDLGGLTRLPRALATHKPAIVIVELGGNDAAIVMPDVDLDLGQGIQERFSVVEGDPLSATAEITRKSA